MKKTKILIAITVQLLLLALMLSSCSLFHKHSFGEWEIKAEATCTEDGSQSRYCECGEVQTETIRAKGHNIEEGVCTDCKKIFDAYKALIQYVKNNGERSDNTYSVSMKVNQYNQRIRFNADTSELSFVEITDSTITQIIIDPSKEKQEVGLVFPGNDKTYYAKGYIYAATFTENSCVYGYISDAPFSLEELLDASTVLLVSDFTKVMQKIELDITMEMLGFKKIK